MRALGGKVIFLNGASSSGKSTVALQLQKILPECFWHFSIDHFIESGMLPMDRIRSKEYSWRELREPFFEGFHRCIPVLVAAGNCLIVEHIIETEEWRQRLQALLSDRDVFLVGMHCPLDELERREVHRGNRRIGDAKRDFETVHTICRYDFEVDATEDTDMIAERIVHAWEARIPAKLSRFSQAGPTGN